MPSQWAEQVREAQRVKAEYNVQSGDILWLLDHWYWPFTDHPVARWIKEIYEPTRPDS